MNGNISFYKIMLLAFLFCCNLLVAQIKNADSAFQVARTLAFSAKYNASLNLCKKILEKTPAYQDVHVLMGRVYFWNKQTDSAIAILTYSNKLKPYEDAYVALSDILRWENKPLDAQKIADEGLLFFISSEALMIRKIKAHYELGEYKAAYHFSDSLAKKNSNSELRQLAERIKNKMSKNIFTISYDADVFDKQFDDPWHLFSVSYGRQTTCLGRVTARINLANRFASNGSQLEMDAYPTLGKKMYAYINAGFSQDPIFSDYRAGLSIYRNFHHAFEGEAGIRLIYFNKATIIYTGSIGKYVGSFWFSLRPTFIAESNLFSQSYSFITRYYFNTSYDYARLTVAYGLSPDDRSRETLLQHPALKSWEGQLYLQRLIKGTNVLSVSIGLVRGEFIQESTNIGNDIFTGIGFQKLF